MVVIGGFVFKFCICIEGIFFSFRGDNFKCLADRPRVGGISAAHVTSTVERQAPRHVVSQILFPVWYFKLEFFCGVAYPPFAWRGILLGVGKLALDGEVYRGVGSLPYCLSFVGHYMSREFRFCL